MIDPIQKPIKDETTLGRDRISTPIQRRANQVRADKLPEITYLINCSISVKGYGIE